MATVSACSGCNGGISNNSSATYTVQAVRLVPFLRQQYSQHFVDNICILKIDAEVRGYKIPYLLFVYRFQYIHLADSSPYVIWTSVTLNLTKEIQIED